MGKKNISLTKNEIENIFKDRAGAKRVSSEAKKLLLMILNDFAKEIAFYSVKYSKNEGKKTVSADHVREAIKYVLSENMAGDE